MKKRLLLFLFAVSTLSALQAQKFGYINSYQLLLSMPEIKKADNELKAYQDELMTKGQNMVKKFEANYKAYMVKVNGGEMSQLQMQQSEQKLADEQQSIQAFEQEVQELIAKRKQDLYEPVLDKVQQIVDQIGKEMEYTMIFDASIGGLLFATEAEDLMPLIKQKLGI